ncbi:MAG: addiction module protein [Verrucomicrobiales bacterium]
MPIDQIAPEALQLPAEDRALLASALWESLGDPNLLSEESDEVAIALAIARDAELESGQVASMSHQELMRCLRQ